MNSKEALEKLCKVKIYQKEASAYDYLGKEIYKEEINTIKQDLERLEALEKENKELKETIEIRKQMNINLIDFGTKLKQQNEKLKKAFKLVTDIYLMNYWDIAKKLNNNIINKQEYELLKEVLDNEES